jgi:hypothetical protein
LEIRTGLQSSHSGEPFIIIAGHGTVNFNLVACYSAVHLRQPCAWNEKESLMPANTQRADSKTAFRLSEKAEQTLTMILSTTGVILFVLTLVVLAYAW